jgi:hypothetical protein
MTKKEAKARKEAWQQALKNGRVVRYNNGCSMRACNTIEEANAFVRQIKTFCPDDMAEIVRIEA